MVNTRTKIKMLIFLPKNIKELLVVAGVLVLYYGILYYQDSLFGDVPKYIFALPILAVGLYFFARLFGFKINLKRKKEFGERYGHKA